MSDFFNYKNGMLQAENLSVAELAAQYGTPFYLYSAEAIKQNYRDFDSALQKAGLNYGIFYAVKANSNQAVISLLKNCGSGADVVSIGEIKRALSAGIPPSKIVFSGVGKSASEIDFALNNEILQFNVESESELVLLNERAMNRGKIAEIALRVNPDVDARTHAKISTGKSENKFGVPISEAMQIYKKAQGMAGIRISGIAMHIGSQLLELDPYRQAWQRMADLAKELIVSGIDIKRLDLGGGLGVAYGSDDSIIAFSDYVNLVVEVFGDLQDRVSFMFEPGRSMVASVGILVTRILHVKLNGNRRFIICDGAMNDFIRPTLYEGFHNIATVEEKSGATIISDIVGPVCESGDYFGKARSIPADIQNGDYLYISDVGAYGAVMSNSYNTRPLIKEVMVQGSESAIIRPILSEEDIIAQDKIPNFCVS